MFYLIAIINLLIIVIIYLFFRQQMKHHDLQTLKILQDSLQQGLTQTCQQVGEALNNYSSDVSKRVDALNLTTDNRLKEINQQVEQRLSRGFEKTTETFTDVIKRLAMIDVAQKKITELSTNVVNLQEILTDKRSRGAFGETQLSALIHNVMPEKSFAFQYTLSNGKRADCILFLPAPSGSMVIDAKFPLENFRIMIDNQFTDEKRKIAEQQFKIDVKKHIQDIAEKYIIPNETADGAMMFIPAEAIFAEIHARHPDLIDLSYRARVWIVSPTTMMAVLTTARSVLKDVATREQIHLIQKHLNLLGNDFERFQKRMDNLARHISQANSDVSEATISAQKITQRFLLIEKANLDEQEIV